MAVKATSIEGLLVLRWPTHEDGCGFFRQTAQTAEIALALGREVVWRQANHARSAAGVLRGFHAEPWDKCVYVARGDGAAAIADIRPGSPTFGEVATFHLGDPPGERIRLFVAEGLGNACCTYGDTDVDYLYDVTVEWQPSDKRAVAWDDPDLNVDWPVTDPVVSNADHDNPTLRERFPEHARFRMADAHATGGRSNV